MKEVKYLHAGELVSLYDSSTYVLINYGIIGTFVLLVALIIWTSWDA